ncbi:MAG: flagellar hook-basal body complex protein FliE [Phycisphaerae bacterium]
MAGINGISGIGQIQWADKLQQAQQNGPSAKADFGDMLKNAVDGIDTDHQKANSALQDLLTGKTDNVLPVINATAKADMSFKLLMGVRNKMIEAYKTTANMQI